MKRIFSFSLIIIIAYLLSAFVRVLIVQTYYIPTISMAPELNVNDRVLVIKSTLFSNEIDYGDIVVFYPSDNSPPRLYELLIDSININKIRNIDINNPVYIKRVVGKEYDHIKISNSGILYINNEVQDYPKIDTNNLNIKEWLVPSGSYFVLGDNLLKSNDSRQYGPIDKKSIVGKAWIKIYPFDEIKVLND
jgi:signal peptidase I